MLERKFIEHMTLDCKLEASREGSTLRIYGTQTTLTIHDVKYELDEAAAAIVAAERDEPPPRHRHVDHRSSLRDCLPRVLRG